MYLGAKRRYINTLPLLCFALLSFALLSFPLLSFAFLACFHLLSFPRGSAHAPVQCGVAVCVKEIGRRASMTSVCSNDDNSDQLSVAGVFSVRSQSHHSTLSTTRSSPTTVLNAKFHYAIHLSSSSLAGLRPAGELVCDLLASWIAPDRLNSITLSSSLAGRRPAHEPAGELGSIMEFGRNQPLVDAIGRRLI